MKKFNILLKTGLISLTLTIVSPWVISAETFKDVPDTFWASKAIDNITNQGLMTGDLSGNFNPDKSLDKFESSKIFAKILGYNTINVSETDKEYYDGIYENYKSFIELYSKSFSKWNATADREIAYLIEKGVLKNEDLNQFVIRDQNDAEYLRALSREELAVFMVRTMGKSNEAASYQVKESERFKDDNLIAVNKKQSVYYLKDMGIITGSTDGNFSPKGAVTRADFCVFIDRMFEKMGKTTSTKDSIAGTSQQNPNVNTIESFSGTIDKYFATLNILQLNIDGNAKPFKITSSATVKVDGYLGTLSQLKEGMQVFIVTNNMEIVELEANTVIPIADIIDQQTDNNDTPSVVPDVTPKQESGYTLSSLNDANKTFDAVLKEKSFDDNDNLESLIVESKTGEFYNIIFTESSLITRNSEDVDSESLKIGDSLVLVTEYDKISSLKANGVKTSVEGYIARINIGKNYSSIFLSSTEDLKSPTEYAVSFKTSDIYSFSIGDRVKLNLDSLETETVSIKKSIDKPYFRGEIVSKKSDYLLIEGVYSNEFTRKKVFYDKSVKVLNAINGNEMSIKDFEEGDIVYVNFYVEDNKLFANSIVLMSDN